MVKNDYCERAGVSWPSIKSLLDDTVAHGEKDYRMRGVRINYSAGGYKIFQPGLILLMSAGSSYEGAGVILGVNPTSVRCAALSLRLPPLWGPGKMATPRIESFSDFEIQLRNLRMRSKDPGFIDQCLRISRYFKIVQCHELTMDWVCGLKNKKVLAVLDEIGVS